MSGRILDIFLDFKFHQNRLENVGTVKGSKFRPFIDLAHRIQQLVAIAQAVIKYVNVHHSDTATQNMVPVSV